MKKLFFFFVFLLALPDVYSQPGHLDRSFNDKGWSYVDIKKGNLYNEYANQVLVTSKGYLVVVEINGLTTLTRYNTHGSLDGDFSSGDFTEPVNIMQAKAAVQTDGKIVIAGYTYNASTGNADFALARYNSNGRLDRDFGDDGIQTTDFDGGYDEAFSVAIQSDGKIVMAGFADNSGTGNYDFALARYNSNGSLDNTFDGDGKQTTDFFGYYNQASAVAIQSDGKIVAAGQAYDPGSSNYDFALVRYNADGSLDNTFDGDGKQTTDFFGSGDYAFSVALQSDGKIVAAGEIYNTGTGNADFALARYNTDGSLDNSFDGDGKQTTDFFGSTDIAYSVAVQSDGKIVAAGQAFNTITNNYDFALTRYNTDGSPDNSFDGDGKQTTDFFGGDDYAASVAIQSDGKIVVAGLADNPAVQNPDIALARYNADGSLDNSFNQDGKATGYYPASETQITAIAVQSNGKIVVAGYTFIDTTKKIDFAVARYKPDGDLDKSFSHDGKQTTNFFNGDDGAFAIAIQKNGKIVLAGTAFNPHTNSYDFALVRYETDGDLDEDFDHDGKKTTDFNGGYDFAYSVAIQKDGKIVAAGFTNGYTPNSDFALARYNTNGSLDNSFDGDGKQTTDFFGSDDEAYGLVIQKDGKIVVAGDAYNTGTSNYDFALARYNTNGSLDNSFDGDGEVTTDFFGGDDYANSVALQNDGKIVAAGQVNNISTGNSDFGLARYNGDGSLDNSFDGDGKQTTDFSGSYDYAVAIAIQKNGKILVAGQAYDTATGSYDFALARYNTNGSPDNSFSADGKVTTNFDGGADYATSLAIYNNRAYVGGYSYSYLQRGILAAYSLGNTSPDVSPIAEKPAKAGTEQDLTQSLTVKVQPNPSTNYFTLIIPGISNTTTMVRVSDASGRLIETKPNVAESNTLQLGYNYRPGIYYAEIIQGNKKAVVKLVKQ